MFLKKITTRKASEISCFFILLVLICACSTDSNKSIKKSSLTKKVITIPTFNADSAYYFIEKQVSFGPRVISSTGSKKCAIWLEKTLKKYTPDVIIQRAPVTTYDQKNHILQNIIASFSPNKINRIALFAHWDSRHIADHDTINQNKPILGANDGGSGVGVLLEIARQISKKQPNIGVDIILFDAEDYGQPENSKFPIMQDSWCLGSQYWSNNLHKPNYFARFGILLDMVGAENATFWHEEISSYYASNILQKVWKKAHQIGFGKYFIFQDAKQIIDDHYYVNQITGIPTIDIIEYDASTKNNFNKHWHTHQDDMDNISKKTLNAVGTTLLSIIYSE